MTRKNWIIFFIVILVIPAPLAIDEYTPSLPAMVHALNAPISSMQLSLTLYMLTLGIGQWISGPLSDAYGRRKIFFSSLIFFFIGSFVCIFATHYSVLLVGRLLQGLGMGAVAMISPAMMGDALNEQETAKASVYYSLIYSLVPILAPVIGGHIQDAFNWRANFVFLLIVAAVFFVLALIKLPETHQPGPEHRLNLKNLIRNQWTILSHLGYLSAVISMLFNWSMIMVFSIVAPFILQQDLGYSATVYGYSALFIGLGFMIGNFSVGKLQKRFNTERIIQVTIYFSVVIALIQLLLALMGHINIVTVIAPSFLLIICAGIIFPCQYAKASTTFTNLAGTAGSLIGVLILGGAVIITAILSAIGAEHLDSMAGTFLVLTLLSVCSYWGMRKS